MIYADYFNISNRSFRVQFAYLLLLIIGGIIFFGSLAAFMKPLGLETAIGARGYFYVVQTIGAFGMFLAPALLFSYCVTKKWFSYSDADKIAPPKLVGYVLILSLFLLPIIACLSYLNEQISLPESLHNIEIWMRKMEDANKAILLTLTANSTLLILLVNLVVMAVLPALFEEFLFRGTLQPFFTKWFGNIHIAIIITAFIFSAIHFQFYGFIPRFLLGIYLGYLFVWGRSLWLPVIAHFMHNAVTLIADYGAQRRGIDLESVDPAQIQGFYPMVMGCFVCVGIGVYYLQARR
jgi:membrane protease YdiL (CAAX protease family)